VHEEQLSINPPVRVGIVDDDCASSAAIADALACSGRYEVLGCAPTLRDGLQLSASKPDLMLIDLGLPDGSGLTLIEHIERAGLHIKTLVFSMFGDAASVTRAIERGAHGYILRSGDVPQVIAALDAVVAGEAPISPAVASHLLARVRETGSSARAHTPTRICLTAKEQVILDALARGLSFKQVATEQSISAHTVGDHVKAIYRKLAVGSRGEAVHTGIQAGLIHLRGAR
jgi:DNA-binding NarL/FixJ family response regulator